MRTVRTEYFSAASIAVGELRSIDVNSSRGWKKEMPSSWASYAYLFMVRTEAAREQGAGE
jgi:hypothetical protein